VAKYLSLFAGVALLLLTVIDGVLAVGPWVMKWYSFDYISDTGDHAEGIAEDWLMKIYGKPEWEFSIAGNMPSPDDKVTYSDKEMGWRTANLQDVNDDRNLSNGIYEGMKGDMSNFVFYGVVVVMSPECQGTIMHVAQDDQLKVWINGRSVAQDTNWTGGPTVTNPYNVHLKKGENMVLIKVSEDGGGDYLNVRFEAEDLEFAADFATISTMVSPVVDPPSPWSNVYHVSQHHVEACDANPGTASFPWRTINRAAETVVAGDTVLIHRGIYREGIRLKSSGSGPGRMITYAGAPGERPVIKGSVVIEGWQQQGNLWTAPWQYPESRFSGYRDSFRYRYEQLFLNDGLLFHAPTLGFLEAFVNESVALAELLATESEAMNINSDRDMSELVSAVSTFYIDGAFWVDYGNEQIYIKLPDGADPNTNIIEASVQPYHFDGKDTEFVRLRDLTFRHCAQWHFQYGAIIAGYGWVLEDLDVGYSAGRGVSLSGAESVRGVKAHHHAALGFGGAAMTVQDCETSDNNYKGGGWLTAENGGWKAVFANGMVVRRHIASRNFGPGIWLDIDNRDSVITQ